MPKFTYIGQSVTGKVERGLIDAHHPEDAREQLRKRGIIVEHVTPASMQILQPTPPVPPAVTKPVSSVQQTVKPAPAVQEETSAQEYVPLSDTFRLYAGWLLAWYSIVYLLGSYQFTKHLPFQIPFLEGLFLSPLVLNFAFGTFLFLLLSSIHRLLGRGLWKGLLLTAVWVIVMTLFAVNA